MPQIVNSSYVVHKWLKNCHIHTIFARFFRKTISLPYKKNIYKTLDDDSIGVDQYMNAEVKSDILVIVLHGLESSSDVGYVKVLMPTLLASGFDVWAMNFRGSNGIENKQFRSYHSGATDDLDCIVREAIKTRKYSKIALIGFSLGGNVVLKYLGEKGIATPPVIKAAAAISVPIDLKACAEKMNVGFNRVYQRRFVRSLKHKLYQKSILFPDRLSMDKILVLKTLKDVDEYYTAPAHGFDSADDYYQKCSSLQFLNKITVPTYLLQAKDDPFLTSTCFPYQQANESKMLWLETPEYGGHVGFLDGNKNTWYCDRVEYFFKKVLLF